MTDKQKNTGKGQQSGATEQNLTPDEAAHTSNTFLGQMGHDQEGKTESFQGNWAGNYGNGYIGSSENFGNEANTPSSSSIGNGLTSDEDDLIAAGQNIDDTGLAGEGTTEGKHGEGASSGYAHGDTPVRLNSGSQGAVMSNDNEEDDIVGDENDEDDIIGDEGPGLATSGDVAAMTGQNVDDLGLPTAADVAGWRQDGGTIGQDSENMEGVDDGRRTTVAENSGEATTGRADTEGGFGQYKQSGDLGEVDPGQQNYVEDQDTRQAFRAGDFNTTPVESPDEGSDKYNPQKTNPTDKGSPE